MAGAPCPPPASQRQRPRCPLHRSRSKKFQSFSISLGMKRLCRFYDPLPCNRSRRANRGGPTLRSVIYGGSLVGFPGSTHRSRVLPLHVLAGSRHTISRENASWRAKKKLKFFFLRERWRARRARLPQPTKTGSMSPASEQVEKISKFFRFLRDEKTLYGSHVVAVWKLHVAERWCRQTHRLALQGAACIGRGLPSHRPSFPADGRIRPELPMHRR